jgi:hypothetical protein
MFNAWGFAEMLNRTIVRETGWHEWALGFLIKILKVKFPGIQ